MALGKSHDRPGDGLYDSEHILPVLVVDVLNTHLYFLALKVVSCLHFFRSNLALSFVTVD